MYVHKIEKPTLVDQTDEEYAEWKRREARSFGLFVLVLLLVLAAFAFYNQGR